MITAKEIISLTKDFVEEEDSDGDDKGDVKLIKTGKGGKNDHVHEYDPLKNGTTTETDGHKHSYQTSDDMTAPADEDDHVHPLPENDDLEA